MRCTKYWHSTHDWSADETRRAAPVKPARLNGIHDRQQRQPAAEWQSRERDSRSDGLAGLDEGGRALDGARSGRSHAESHSGAHSHSHAHPAAHPAAAAAVLAAAAVPAVVAAAAGARTTAQRADGEVRAEPALRLCLSLRLGLGVLARAVTHRGRRFQQLCSSGGVASRLGLHRRFAGSLRLPNIVLSRFRSGSRSFHSLLQIRGVVLQICNSTQRVTPK